MTMETIQDVLFYYSQNAWYVWEQFFRHFLMSIYGVLFAAIVAIPLGILIARHHRLSTCVISLANIIQTITALVLHAILMLVNRFGPNKVVFARFLFFFFLCFHITI